MSAASPRIITIPYNFTPRPYQLPLFNCLSKGYRRALVLWHRRAGKDKTLWNLVIKEALKAVGVYYYFFPTFTQGRRSIWDGIDNDGFRMLDHLPPEVVSGRPNSADMRITLANGSIIQIIGTDGFDKLVGPNPRGCVFSEFSLQDPQAWELVRPILAANQGWAIFNYTPRGKNHAYDLHMLVKDNPRWFTQVLTVNETGAISQQQIQEEVEDGMTPDMVQQEFYCSYEASIVGAIFAAEMRQAMEQERIGVFPPLQGVPLNTYWDLGVNDFNCIWLGQYLSGQHRMVGYLESMDEPLVHYVNAIQAFRDQHKLAFGVHVLPHDGQHRRMQVDSAKSTRELLEELGLRTETAPRPREKRAGIEAARQCLPRCFFDEKETRIGLEGLRSYRREWSQAGKTMAVSAVHDEASHRADAFQTMALYYQRQEPERREMKKRIRKDRRRYGSPRAGSWMRG